MALLCVAILGAESPKPASPGAKPLADPPGIHNLYALGTNLFSGSAPEGDAAFAALARLGVKTIITVDGAKPDVEPARKYGIRYIHLPHGYDGISANTQLKLVKAGAELPGPIYVHCHHGKHRGPAAAAIICMSREGWSPAQAESWLKAAGTASNYTGLYSAVRNFKSPPADDLKKVPSDFPEVAKVSGLTDSMVGVDQTWEHLKKIRAAGYQPPQDHPDLKPASEAVILWEHYREAQRFPESAQHGKDFLNRLQAAEAEAKSAEGLLRQFAASPAPGLRHQLDQSFDAMAKTCFACHKTYRDAEGIKAAK